MKCPKCGGPTSVYESRPLDNSQIRGRSCKKCGKTFITIETCFTNEDIGQNALNAAQREMARRVKLER